VNDKQKAFADYYIETGNQTESAKRAGYSEKTAYSIGNRLLKKVEVSTYIRQRTTKAEKKRIASGDEVMEFFSSVMKGEIKDAFGLDPTLQDRINAAKELAKRTVDLNKETEEYESDGFIDALKGQVAETFKDAGEIVET
jgi:phage terminase small subunit